MKIEIFDVEHGQCAVIHCPNGKRIMVDAGHKSFTWWPSSHFLLKPMELLIITNYDEDHTSDVEGVKKYCGVNAILGNPTINSERLKQMKNLSCGMGKGIQHIYEWMRWVEQQPGGAPAYVDLGEVSCRWYCNTYGTGTGQFTKANDLSVVAFISFGAFTILFPGDLETAGWEQLLHRQDFREDLARVTVLVASHHGRDNGRCEEVFNYCSPQAVIVSDAGKQHSTQETRDWYAACTSGCITQNGKKRWVITTRDDGKITIDVVNAQGGWNISTDARQPAPTSALASLFTG